MVDAGDAGDAAHAPSKPPDAAPPRVEPCGGGQALRPGVWEELIPKAIQADFKQDVSIGMMQVAVDPVHPNTVYASAGTESSITHGSGLFKSIDCGATWSHVNTGANGTVLDSGFIWQMMLDPSNPRTIYAANGYGGPPSYFKSTNGGVDWIDLNPAQGHVQYDFVQAGSMDPGDPKHLVLTFHANCTDDYAPMCMAETTDGGATFRLFKAPVDGFLEGAAPFVIGKTSFLLVTPFNGNYYTGDGGATWKSLGKSGYAGYVVGDKKYVPSNDGILVSADGIEWTVIPSSPKATNLEFTEDRVFASFGNDYTGQPIWSASTSDLSKWTNVATPTMKHGGSFAYDRAHHILFVSAWSAGLWRVVLE
jgi:hypothetical protein